MSTGNVAVAIGKPDIKRGANCGGVLLVLLHLEIEILTREPLLVVFIHRLFDDGCLVAGNVDTHKRLAVPLRVYILCDVELDLELLVRVENVAI